MELERIRRLMSSTMTGRSVAEYVSNRKRAAKEGISHLPTLEQQIKKEGHIVVTKEMEALFKGLAEAGVGNLKGNVFYWSVPINKLLTAKQEAKKEEPKEEKKSKKALKQLAVCFADERIAFVEFSPGLTKEDVGFLTDSLLYAINEK